MSVDLVHIPGHGVWEEKVPDLDVEVVYDPEFGPLVDSRFEPGSFVGYQLIEIDGVQVPVPSGRAGDVLNSIELDKQERENAIGRYKVGDFVAVDDEPIFGRVTDVGYDGTAYVEFGNKIDLGIISDLKPEEEDKFKEDLDRVFTRRMRNWFI